MYYNARFYDPLLSRFTSADTLIPEPGNPQAWDRYAYTLNNPVKYTDPSGYFSEDAITEYLMGYFEGDEEAALRTLQLWKQDKKWWEMISIAGGGDNLIGYQWWVEPNYTTGNSKDFISKFIGQGQDFLAGIQGYDLVAMQRGIYQDRNYQDWNIEFVGLFRQVGNEAPTCWSPNNDWYTMTMKPGWSQISRDAFGGLIAFAGPAIKGPKLIQMLMTFMVGAVSERVQLPDKIIDEIHWGENDIRVIFPGGGQVNFEYKDGNYYFEGID